MAANRRFARNRAGASSSRRSTKRGALSSTNEPDDEISPPRAIDRVASAEEGAVADDEGLGMTTDEELEEIRRRREEEKRRKQLRWKKLPGKKKGRGGPSKNQSPLLRGSDASGEDNDEVDPEEEGVDTSEEDGEEGERGGVTASEGSVEDERDGTNEVGGSESRSDSDSDSLESESSDESDGSDESVGSVSDSDSELEPEPDGTPAISSDEVRHAVALASEAAAETFGWKKETIPSAVGHGGGGNALSDAIPGYIAPMRLEASSSRGAGGGGMTDLSKLCRLAERTDASTAGAVMNSVRGRARAAAMMGRVGGCGGSAVAAPSTFKTGAKRRHDGTAGSGWFGFAPARLDDELKTDLSLIRNRTYLDPKRFYKKTDDINSKMVQVGTVAEGAGEYFSARLSKRERRTNLAEELMADGAVAGYARRQSNKIQRAAERRFGGGRGKGRGKRMSVKRRRGY